MSNLPNKIRSQVFVRAQNRCEYCQTAKIIVITMEIDHIIPIASGSDDSLDNLCLACISCNSYNGAFQTGIDPESGHDVSLFNPRKEDWHEHFRWSTDGDVLIDLTGTGNYFKNTHQSRGGYYSKITVGRGWMASTSVAVSTNPTIPRSPTLSQPHVIRLLCRF